MKRPDAESLLDWKREARPLDGEAFRSLYVSTQKGEPVYAQALFDHIAWLHRVYTNHNCEEAVNRARSTAGSEKPDPRDEALRLCALVLREVIDIDHDLVKAADALQAAWKLAQEKWAPMYSEPDHKLADTGQHISDARQRLHTLADQLKGKG